MRSYGAARGYFSFVEFIAWLAIIGGGILIVLAVGVSVTANPIAAALAAAPGIAIIMIGIFTLVNIQSARATVDSAEYAQQSLKLSRDQFELSKEMLALAKAGTAAPDAAAMMATTALENVSFDTDAPAPAGAANASAQPALNVRQYAGVAITEEGGKFLIDDRSYDTLADAQLSIDGSRSRRPERMEAS